ncbi:MAG: flagellar hook-basal body complex protein [Candidatus Melainabacteria bacterium]
MVYHGRINMNPDGMAISSMGMLTQMAQLNTHTDNISNFGVPGYQRKTPVVTSFVEYLGPEAVEEGISTEIGRMRLSGNPLDIALNTRGYFQKLNADGSIELTRDGRFKIDAEGYLRASDGRAILSSAGTPVQLPAVPDDLKKGLKITPGGDIQVFDPRTGVVRSAGALGVVSKDGSAVAHMEIVQGYVEDANVNLQQEFVSLMPLRRQFESNRQLFIIQSDVLSRMLQELGRTS